jgi:hypothetical protein
MHRADDSRLSRLLVSPAAYISADIPLAQKKAIAAVRLAAAPILVIFIYLFTSAQLESWC